MHTGRIASASASAGLMSMPMAYCATAYSPHPQQQMPPMSQMPTYPAHFSPLVTRPMDTVANLNPGAREMFRSISPNLNPNPGITSTPVVPMATPSVVSFGFRSLASVTQGPAPSPLTVSSAFPPPPPPPLPPARNGASALDLCNSNASSASIPMPMGSLPRAGTGFGFGNDSGLAALPESGFGPDSSNKSSPNSGTGSGSFSLTRPLRDQLASAGAGPAFNPLSSLEGLRALSNSPAAERRAVAAATNGRKYSPSPVVTNTFI